MVLLKSKIRWVALIGLALSALSLAVHFLLARFFAKEGGVPPELIKSDQLEDVIRFPITAFEDASHGKVWSRIKSLQTLRPYAAARKDLPAPTEKGNGFLFARIKGEFHEIRASICDLVVVARLLNATLVLPELEDVALAKGISSKFKGFGHIYNEKHFITALKRDVLVLRRLPDKFKAAKKKKAIFLKSSISLLTPKFYLEEILPVLKNESVLGLVLSSAGCLQSTLPSRMAEFQRLRCRVAFEALQFRSEILELGSRMVQRLQALGQPYLAFHTGLERDSLAFHGCAERFQDVHTELIQYKRARMIKQGHVTGNLSVDSELQWKNGSCPLMPEEVGVLLRTLGYSPHTRIYISGSEVFGGQRVLIPLRAMFSNLEDRMTLTTEEERNSMYGPEEALPPPPPSPPPPSPDDIKRMIAAWQAAGPRPRPLPPPPSRRIYTHEREGWWGWVAVSDEEPPPSIFDLRHKRHKLLWAALDYIVCVESTAFFPGFDHDGNGKPNFASLVMGHRAHMYPSLRTYRPDRKEIALLFGAVGDKMYHPKRSWVVSARGKLNATLGDEGLKRAQRILKPDMFLSQPLPECSCRLALKLRIPKESLGMRHGSKEQTFGTEDVCPSWMESDMMQLSGEVYDELDMETDDMEVSEAVDVGNAEGNDTDAPQVTKAEKDDSQIDGDEDVDTND